MGYSTVWKKSDAQRVAEMKEACLSTCHAHASGVMSDKTFLGTMAYIMVRDDECLDLIFKGVQAQKAEQLEYISEANSVLSMYMSFTSPHNERLEKKMVQTIIWDRAKELYVKWGDQLMKLNFLVKGLTEKDS